MRLTVQADDLVRMANQVAQFFGPYPEADAVEGIREHLEKFWSHSMRDELARLAARQQEIKEPESAPPTERQLAPRVLQAVAALQAAKKE